MLYALFITIILLPFALYFCVPEEINNVFFISPLNDFSSLGVLTYPCTCCTRNPAPP